MINHNESFSNIGLNLKATYTQLPEILFSKLMPISVKAVSYTHLTLPTNREV